MVGYFSLLLSTFLFEFFDLFHLRCVSGHNFGRASVKVWPYIFSHWEFTSFKTCLALVFSDPEWMVTAVGCGLNIGLDG